MFLVYFFLQNVKLTDGRSHSVLARGVLTKMRSLNDLCSLESTSWGQHSGPGFSLSTRCFIKILVLPNELMKVKLPL